MRVANDRILGKNKMGKLSLKYNTINIELIGLIVTTHNLFLFRKLMKKGIK